MDDHWKVIEDALTFWRSGLELDEERMHIDAALAFVREQRTPQPNNVPLYTNEQIDDIVDNYIFLNNGTSTYRVWEDRANKYLRELRDKYEQEIAFWQKYGVTKNLRVLELEAERTPQQGDDDPGYLGSTDWVGSSGKTWKVDLYQEDNDE